MQQLIIVCLVLTVVVLPHQLLFDAQFLLPLALVKLNFSYDILLIDIQLLQDSSSTLIMNLYGLKDQLLTNLATSTEQILYGTIKANSTYYILVSFKDPEQDENLIAPYTVIVSYENKDNNQIIQQFSGVIKTQSVEQSTSFVLNQTVEHPMVVMDREAEKHIGEIKLLIQNVGGFPIPHFIYSCFEVKQGQTEVDLFPMESGQWQIIVQTKRLREQELIQANIMIGRVLVSIYQFENLNVTFSEENRIKNCGYSPTIIVLYILGGIFFLFILVSIIVGIVFLISKPRVSMTFEYRTYYIPKPNKNEGEDAHYAHPKMLIVADGVGDWKDYGIDSGIYSRALCKIAAKLLQKNDQQWRLRYPQNIMEVAAKKNRNKGSSTMLVLTISGDQLKYSNIGDSAFMHIRKLSQNKYVYTKSKTQWHKFNLPFQLQYPISHNSDLYRSSNGIIKLQENDIIVVATDGLYDNVTQDQIVNKVKQSDQNGTLLKELPRELALMATTRGKNRLFDSPFSERARKEGMEKLGGKLDDTTVIIARVKLQTSIQSD